MKKRGKNVYSESSEYHADTDVDTSVGKSLQQSPVLPTHLRVMEMAVSYMFLFSLSSNEREAKDEVMFVQIWEASGWARKKTGPLVHLEI